MEATSELYDRIVDKSLLIRRLNITTNHVIREADAEQEVRYEQPNLFTDYDTLQVKRNKGQAELDREKKMQKVALTRYDDAVTEAARITGEKIGLDESSQAALDMKQYILMDVISEQPEITVAYFKKDERKACGAYLTLTDNLKKIDEYERVLVQPRN